MSRRVRRSRPMQSRPSRCLSWRPTLACWCSSTLWTRRTSDQFVFLVSFFFFLFFHRSQTLVFLDQISLRAWNCPSPWWKEGFRSTGDPLTSFLERSSSTTPTAPKRSKSWKKSEGFPIHPNCRGRLVVSDVRSVSFFPFFFCF